ncbi:MAG: FGGY-family carbohydrate kinase, partial [Janthinobacterium lividum]
LGGGSRSKVWCQIVADVMNRRVDVVREPESTCLGAGMLAASAVGLHDGIREASEAMSGVGTGFVPEAGAVAAYDRLYRVYVKLYPALREMFAELAAAQTEAT